MYLQSITIQEKEAKKLEELIKLADTYQMLGRVYYSLNQSKNAEIYYKKKADLYLQAFGQENE